MIEMLRLSTKGQVMIPKSVRDRLDLKKGDKLVAFTRRDMIVLRKVEGEENILSILSQLVRKKIKNLDIIKEDVNEAVLHA
jgi:AbrB family looped-hinge helix DNA binding protein